MAVDTRSRRAACLGVALAFNLTLPAPDGAVGTEDRVHVAYSYPGLFSDDEAEVVDILLTGSYVPSISLTGSSKTALTLTGSYRPSISLTGIFDDEDA